MHHGFADASMVLRGSIAAINAAMDGLSFLPTADFSGPANLTLTLSDLGNTGAPGVLLTSGTVTILVDAANDAPTLTAPANQTVNEDTVLIFSAANANAIVIDDVDAAGGPIQLTLSAGNGRISLASLGALTLIAGSGVADTTVTFSGTLANVNAALNGLAYLADTDFNGADQLSISVSDLGNSGQGGAQTVGGAIAITVAAVNDAPTDLIRTPALSVVETAADDTPAGTVVVVDVDDQAGFTFALIDNAGHFRIDTLSGAITVAGVALPEYDLTNQYIVIVRVTDPMGATIDRQFTIPAVRRTFVPPTSPGAEKGQPVVLAPPVDTSESRRQGIGDPLDGDHGSARRRLALPHQGATRSTNTESNALLSFRSTGNERVRRTEELQPSSASDSESETKRARELRRLFDLRKFERIRAAEDGGSETSGARHEQKLVGDSILWEPLDQEVKTYRVAIEAMQVSGAAVSVGLMFYALRAGGLVAAMLSALPAWSSLDPLVVLAKDRDEKKGRWGATYDDMTEMERDEAGVRNVIQGSTRMTSAQFSDTHVGRV